MHRMRAVAAALAICLPASLMSPTPSPAAAVLPEDQGDKPGYIAVAESTLYAEPSVESPALQRLSWGHSVGIHTDSYRQVSINGQDDRWVFVTTSWCVARDCKARWAGWVIDSEIATEDRFQPMTAWRQSEVRGAAGDYEFIYRTEADGRFTHWSWRYRDADPCDDTGEQRNGRYCVGSGQLYHYRNLVWAKGYGYMYLNETGDLCSVFDADPGEPRMCDR